MDQIPQQVLEIIKEKYICKRTLLDRLERRVKKLREKLFGVDLSVFDKTIRYYDETKGSKISRQEAYQKALDKQKHKDAWDNQARETIADIMHFYQEVDIYPFRQPYLKRLGGYRWYLGLVAHITNPSVLEYGCGTAALTEHFMTYRPNGKFTVADIPSTTLDFVKWKKQAYQYPLQILTIGTGKEGIPLKENYDLIICENVLEHTPNPHEIVEAFTERLNHGGVLICDFIEDPGGENLQMAYEQRQAVKTILKDRLTPLKLIDEDDTPLGLYIKT